MTTHSSVLDQSQPWEDSVKLLEKVLDTSRPEAIYGAPQTQGEQVIISTSEVMSGLGIGFGSGTTLRDPTEDAKPEKAEAAPEEIPSEGKGFGGGSYSYGRPVAVIVIRPDGVEIKPVIDLTKIGLAALAAVASMAAAMAQGRRALRGR